MVLDIFILKPGGNKQIIAIAKEVMSSGLVTHIISLLNSPVGPLQNPDNPEFAVDRLLKSQPRKNLKCSFFARCGVST